jgi:hypothetical protein
MESKEIQEIKAGDCVWLKSGEQNKGLMTVGKITDGVATCFWMFNHELKQADIPTIALYRKS